MKFLAKTLKIPKSKIEILRGEASRLKVVRIYTEIDKSLCIMALLRKSNFSKKFL